MKKEDIEKAAQDYDDGLIYSSVKEQCDLIKAFKAGAEYRINSVWHSNTEVPKRNIDKHYSGEAILIQLLDEELNFGIVYYGYGYNGNMWYTVTCIDKTYTMDEIKRWAYVNDLIPDTEV